MNEHENDRMGPLVGVKKQDKGRAKINLLIIIQIRSSLFRTAHRNSSVEKSPVSCCSCGCVADVPLLFDGSYLLIIMTQ